MLSVMSISVQRRQMKSPFGFLFRFAHDQWHHSSHEEHSMMFSSIASNSPSSRHTLSHSGQKYRALCFNKTLGMCPLKNIIAFRSRTDQCALSNGISSICGSPKGVHTTKNACLASSKAICVVIWLKYLWVLRKRMHPSVSSRKSSSLYDSDTCFCLSL